MTLIEGSGQSTLQQRPWPSMAATLLIFLVIAVGAAPAWSLSQGAGPVEERAPKDAPSLWLHRDGARDSRIVLETADGVYVREWRSVGTLDERTRREVREALNAIAPPSRAVLIKVRPEVAFATLKSLMLACGPKEPVGYHVWVEEVAQFPARVLGPGR